MKTIYDIFKANRRLKKGLGEFGIEIETETKNASNYPADFFGDSFMKETVHGQKIYWQPRSIPEWYVTEDGSLRDFGREFVLKNPLDYGLAMSALESWGTALKSVKFNKDAPATSVHVHMNVTEMTLIQLANLLCLLIFFENLLTEFSGDIRRSNTFARPIRCADTAVENFQSLISSLELGKREALKFNEQHTKYGVINLATIHTYGSVEIRCFRGTTDYVQIQDWLTILNRIYKFAKIPGLTPLAFYETYQDITTEIVDRVFGSDAPKLKCKNWKNWLERNEFYLADFATLMTDWNSLGSRYEVEKPDTKLGKKLDQFLNEPTILAAPVYTQQPGFDPWNVAGAAGVVVVDEDIQLDTYPEPEDLDDSTF